MFPFVVPNLEGKRITANTYDYLFFELAVILFNNVPAERKREVNPCRHYKTTPHEPAKLKEKELINQEKVDLLNISNKFAESIASYHDKLATYNANFDENTKKHRSQIEEYSQINNKQMLEIESFKYFTKRKILYIEITEMGGEIIYRLQKYTHNTHQHLQ